MSDIIKYTQDEQQLKDMEKMSEEFRNSLTLIRQRLAAADGWWSSWGEIARCEREAQILEACIEVVDLRLTLYRNGVEHQRWLVLSELQHQHALCLEVVRFEEEEATLRAKGSRDRARMGAEEAAARGAQAVHEEFAREIQRRRQGQ